MEGVEAVATLLAAKNTNEQVLVQAFRALARAAPNSFAIISRRRIRSAVSVC